MVAGVFGPRICWHTGAIDALVLTGERTVPDVAHENYWFRRHEAAYGFAAHHVRGRVLEVGCGEGYGTALLGSEADHIVGVDYDAATIAHAARRYRGAAFVRGNLAALPVRTASIDVVVTLQVIEHVWNHPEFIRECRRAIRPGGQLLVTTPNRLTFSPGRTRPVNPFHTVEFTAAELARLLTSNGFAVDRVAGLHGAPGIDALDERYGGSFVRAQLDTPPAQWAPALAADVRAVTVDDFVVLDAGERDVDRSLDLILWAVPAP